MQFAIRIQDFARMAAGLGSPAKSKPMPRVPYAPSR